MANGNARPYDAKIPGGHLRASYRTFGRPLILRACEYVMKLEKSFRLAQIYQMSRRSAFKDSVKEKKAQIEMRFENKM